MVWLLVTVTAMFALGVIAGLELADWMDKGRRGLMATDEREVELVAARKAYQRLESRAEAAEQRVRELGALERVARSIIERVATEGEDGGWYTPPSSAPSDEGDDYADRLPEALERCVRDWEANASQGWGFAGQAEAKLATAVEALRKIETHHIHMHESVGDMRQIARQALAEIKGEERSEVRQATAERGLPEASAEELEALRVAAANARESASTGIDALGRESKGLPAEGEEQSNGS